MKTKLPLIFIILFLFLGAKSTIAQKNWSKINSIQSINSSEVILNEENLPRKHDLYFINTNNLSKSLTSKSTIQIELPDAKGGLSRFRIKERSSLSPELAKKFPMIKSYDAFGLDDITATAKISIGTDGLHAMIFSANEETIYVDPYTKDKNTVIAYKKSDLTSNKNSFTCQVEEFSKKSINPENYLKTFSNVQLRTYRLAVVCSAEYSQFHLTNQNISSSASASVKKAAVLSAINTTVTRVNGIFEKDLAVRMQLVADNDKIIFLNSATDGITDGDPDKMIEEVQTICDNQIGNANYDIGHIFSIGGDGLAGLGVVCQTGNKAQGVTGRSQPIGDAYDIDFVAHELGHQFGATHTQNNSCQRTNSTAVEPGSASSIMGYAGICAPNVQGQSDDHFHAVSIAQMQNVIQSSGNCASLSSTSNAIPTANAGLDYTIPKSTPFVLRGTATDANGLSGLTYNWEQIDNQIAIMPPEPTNTGGPLFRSLPSKTNPNRYMPDLVTVVAGNLSTTWEVLPAVSREMNFAFTVRDNHPGGGGTARDDAKITVDGNVGPFTVATPPTWGQNTTQNLAWSVANTNTLPVNCQNVTIKLSTDGGITFPTTLLSNTPNDGNEQITMPNIADTDNAYIMVEAADNIFYTVSDKFKITNAADYTLTNLSGEQSVCILSSNSVTYSLEFKTSNGFNENTTLSLSQVPSNASVSFSKNNVNSDTNIELTVTNLRNVTTGNYTMKLRSSSASITREIDVKLNIANGVCASNGNTGFQTSTTFVGLGNISNSTSKSSNGYGNFKSQTTTVKGGQSYNLRVNVNTDGQFRTVTFAWIDWNQDCDFDDDGEQYFLGDAVNTPNGATSLSPLSISVPTAAFNGSTTIRVSTKYADDGNPSACETNFDGEVEDYTLIVEDATASISNSVFERFNLYPNPTKGEFTLSLQTTHSDEIHLQLFDVRGRLIDQKKYAHSGGFISKKVFFEKASSGLYLLIIKNKDKQLIRKLVIE